MSRSLFSINQLKKTLPKSCLMSLYKSLIHPHSNYGIQIWGNAKATYLNKIIRHQKRAMRIVNNASYNSHTEPVFKSNGILKVKDCFEHQVIIFMYDYQHNNLPSSFNNMFPLNSGICKTTQVTRQSNMFHIPVGRNNFSNLLPRTNYPKIWNRWHNDVHNIASKKALKKHVKNIMLSRYSKHITCDFAHCSSCNSL